MAAGRVGRVGLSYRCRHVKIPGLARLTWLRKRIGASPVIGSPIAPARRQAKRYWSIACEIRAIERQLVESLRLDVATVLEKRYARRYRRRRPAPGDL
jgi:hypothetical protein